MCFLNYFPQTQNVIDKRYPKKYNKSNEGVILLKNDKVVNNSPCQWPLQMQADLEET